MSHALCLVAAAFWLQISVAIGGQSGTKYEYLMGSYIGFNGFDLFLSATTDLIPWHTLLEVGTTFANFSLKFPALVMANC